MAYTCEIIEDTVMANSTKYATKKGAIRYWIDPIYKGRRLGSGTFKAAAEARQNEREILSKASKGGVDLTHTFGTAMVRYRLEISPRKKSAHWEDIRMRKVQRDEIARVKLAGLSHEDFGGWIERERVNGLKDASIRREFGVLC
ncbi:hypothetical protein AB833_10145 [Chromatiales bacterium (ex Bugula neritina AB1)]|nr:hypothetical protein AB833_10145 [Chromatiales bacterium (ex Bugula neritina AB1)]